MMNGNPAFKKALEYFRAAIRSDIEFAKKINEKK